MKIRVLSVPHTGTRFTFKLLRSAGFTQIGLSQHLKIKDWEFFHQHFYGNPAKYNFDNRYRLHGDPFAYEMPTIIPLRRIEDVRISFAKRGRDGMDLEQSWAEMERWMDDHEYYPLRVDDKIHRDGDLHMIENLIGKTLSVDWNNKVGHKEVA